MPRMLKHQDNLWYIEDYGYIQTKKPCDICIEQVLGSTIRPASWKYNCQCCGNYIVYDYVGGYSNCIGRNGRDVLSINKFAQLHYFQPGKQGTIPKKDKKKS